MLRGHGASTGGVLHHFASVLPRMFLPDRGPSREYYVLRMLDSYQWLPCRKGELERDKDIAPIHGSTT